MLERLFAELGPWNWIVLGLILMIFEVAAPGIFFLWFGIAALIVGGLAILFGETSWMHWQIQVILFLILSVIAVFIGRRLIGATDVESRNRTRSCSGHARADNRHRSWNARG
jgi:membrane protein implicated in regulation of membrane protease activity